MRNRSQILIAILALMGMSVLTLAQEQPLNWQQYDGGSFLNRSADASKPGAAPAGASFAFDVVDFPGVSAHQNVHAINDKGRMVGLYTDASSNTNGYLLQGSTFKTIVYPAAGVNVTTAWGINKSGVIVGFYSTDHGTTGHGFTLKGKTYSSFDYPGAVVTGPSAINASGSIVGQYSLTGQDAHGFLLSKGSFTTIDVPSAATTSPFAINAAGIVVGAYQQPDLSEHGFVLQNGVYTTVDYPGATECLLAGINDSGQIVGSYSADGGASFHGFLLSAGVFTSFDVPFGGVVNTYPAAINNKGQIAGRYIDSAGFRWGFVATFQ